MLYNIATTMSYNSYSTMSFINISVSLIRQHSVQHVSVILKTNSYILLSLDTK